jgi:hypothetical protein
LKNRGFVLLIVCIIFLTFLTSCKSTKTKENNVNKTTAENQRSSQVVNVNIEKSESNTYGCRDDDIS